MRFELHLCDVVDATCHKACHVRKNCTSFCVCTSILQKVKTICSDTSVLGTAHTSALALCTTMAHRQHVFGTALCPTNGNTQFQCSPTDNDFFCIHTGLCTEATTNVGSNHAHLIFLKSESVSKAIARTMCTLATCPLCEACAIPLRRTGTNFHWRWRNTLILNSEFNNNFAIGENIALFTSSKCEYHIASGLRVEQYVTLVGLIHVEHDWQWLVINNHGFCGIDAKCLIGADNDCNDVAHEAHRVLGDIRERNSCVHHRVCRWCRVQRDIISGPHMQDARHRACFISINRQQLRVSH